MLHAADPLSSIADAVTVFRAQKDLAERAIAQVTDANLHISLDANTNSIAVIMQHMAGNMLSRWTDFLTTDGEKPDRDRDGEFVDGAESRGEVMQRWERGWSALFQTLASLTVADLGKTVAIRGEPHSIALAINRQLSHYGYHVGQIVMIARIFARDEWTTLTIPRGGSAGYNQRTWAR
jgi:hypothetical protein